MRFYLALWVAKAVNIILRILSPAGGSTYPGYIALKIDPSFIAHIKGKDAARTVLITGTNGKTTTTHLIHHILTRTGHTAVSNLEGANVLRGVARVYLRRSSLTGRMPQGVWTVLECDERTLAEVTAQLDAQTVVVVNLNEDQVQRNGDPDFVFTHLKAALKPTMHLILNADEPKSRSLGIDHPTITTFAVDRLPSAHAPASWFGTTPCPICHHPLDFQYFNNQNQGHYTCTHCAYTHDPEPDICVTAYDAASKTVVINGDTYPMPLNLPHMIYNEAAAVAFAQTILGLSPDQIAEALTEGVHVSGRYEVFTLEDRTIKCLRIKQENPETLQNVVNLIGHDPTPKIVILALLPIEDYKHWHMNVSYAIACDMAQLLASPIARIIHIGEAVSYDTYRFLHYLGVPDATQRLIPTANPDHLFDMLLAESCTNIYLVSSVRFYGQMVDEVKKGRLDTQCPDTLRKY